MYTIEINITASNPKEAQEKANALSVIEQELTSKELVKLAWIVKNDPSKKAMAKKALGV